MGRGLGAAVPNMWRWVLQRPLAPAQANWPWAWHRVLQDVSSTSPHEFLSTRLVTVAQCLVGIQKVASEVSVSWTMEREKHLELFHDDDNSLSGYGIGDLNVEELSAPIPTMEALVVNID
ncbi:hypothetical protein TIFTF001_030718 [Ficus carica]|uniref:Uncharacterized protein n=1 Tax=Ficus carica TaxID=3494 RepID=A0AA88DTW9_FICCA|nr:hypothetical protein TIFTF001_030718 [Ficus carica]